MKYHSINRILKDKQIIFIDGITRTGKLLLGSLVSSFNHFEHLEFGENFEFLLPALRFKKVKKDFVNAFLNNYLNQLIYNKFIGRNVNFRPTDRTGIENSRDPKIYHKRLNLPEGSSVLKLIKKTKGLQLPFVTHEIAVNLNLLFSMNMNFKIIEIIRNPVDTAYSWYKRGLGKRFGEDQRMFTLLINQNTSIHPWYRALQNTNINNLNECEKCIYYVLILNYLSNKNLLKYKNKRNVFVTCYEKLITNPTLEINKISSFLDTKINYKTIKFLKKENLPFKDISKIKKNHINKTNVLKKLTSKKLFEELIELEKQYESNYYKLLKI